MISLHKRLMVVALLACLTSATSAPAAQEPQLTEEEMRNFLLTAEVVKSKQTSKGITGVFRLTLSDGKVMHDASFQSIDEYKQLMRFDSGRVEAAFRDSYKYNIAAYELAKILGVGDMMPVTVARKWNGKTGSLSWWLPAKLDEETRQKKKITPPDPEGWSKQMHKMWVFAQLVFDTDRNMGNVLFSEDWHLWMIDFSRAFRLHYDLEDAKKLARCDRRLFESLRRLDAAEVTAKTKSYLTSAEIQGIMARRDKIVALFEKLIAQKGEAQVLY